MTGTMTMPMDSANGRHRRSLNDTITRLDEMIDGLSAAIPDTIRDTLKESVAESIAEGVKAAVVEVLSNQALADAMRRPARPPLLRQKLGEALGRARATVARWVFRAITSVAGTPKQLRERARWLWSLRRPVIIAMGIGMVVGFGVAWTPPWVSGTITGLGAAGLSLTVQAGLWARRAIGRLLPV